MKNRIALNIVWSVALLASFIFTVPVFAAAPEPLSEGKFIEGKGTKAAPDYEGRAGGPFYEYGRGFQVMGFQIKPHAQYSANYEDNIFYAESGKQDDFINRLEAGATAELPINGGQHLFSAGYLAQHEFFADFDDQDHTDHTFTGALDLNFVPFSINARDILKDTVSRADTEFTQRTYRYENQIDVLLDIPFATFFLESELDDFNINYYKDARNDVFDHNILTFYQRIGYELAPSTQVLVEYGRGNIDYEEDEIQPNRDGDIDQICGGLRGSLGTRMTYQAWLGFQNRTYEDETRPDFDGVVARAALQYDLTEKSFLMLKGGRGVQESTFDNQSFYTRNRAELIWKQQLRERLFFQTREIVDYNEYSRISTINGDSETRRDWVWQTGLGLEYTMPNDLISFFAEYKFNSRDSNTFNLDYDAQSVTAGVKSLF